MEKRQLGNTAIHVSKICLGTMTFGEQNTEKEGHEQLDYALSNGVNFIDTAEMYAVPGRKETQGSTERIIGNWIRQRHQRDRFVLATKITGPSARFQGYMRPLNYQPASIRTALEGSLRRLQTDYVDLYQLHWPERVTNFFGKRGYEHKPTNEWKDNFDAITATMHSLIKEGKIRHWGVSNETPWGLMHYLQIADREQLPRPVSIQNPYSLLNRTFETGLAEIALREKTGLLAYSPMAFGLLSGKFHKKTARADARIHQFKQMARYNSANSWKATEAYLTLAENHNLSLAQMSLAFVTQQPFTTSTIVGATSMAQLRENIESAKVVLSKEVMRKINAIQELIPNPAP